MLVKRTKTRFTDLDLNFTKHPNTKDVSRLSDARAINRAIRNLVFTDIYESPFHPEISCQIRKMLFENMDSNTVVLIQKTIEYAITNFEPRVNLISVNVTPDSSTSIQVVIVYQIVGLSEMYQVSFNLERSI